MVLNIVPSMLLETRNQVVPNAFTNATKINKIAGIIGRYDLISLLFTALLYGRSIILLVT